MENILGIVALVFVLVVVAGVIRNGSSPRKKESYLSEDQQYHYSRKASVMTPAEWRFYRRLEAIAKGRYHVFPQIHLSSLMSNETKGKYYKLAYQRINRRSVDYVLCDIESGAPAYAVELDDWSHDSAKRQARDVVVKEMLDQVGLPLVRFRDVEKLSDDDIREAFRSAMSSTGVN